MTERDDRLLSVAAGVERAICDIIASMPPSDLAGSTYDQLGLADGAQTVASYLEHGELGLAIHHLCYMLDETGLAIPDADLRFVHDLANRVGERPPKTKPRPVP